MVAVFCAEGVAPARGSAIVCGAGFVARVRASPSSLDERSPHGAAIVADAIFRDRWAATAQVLIAGCGVVAVLISYGERMREENIAEYYALLAAAGAGMVFFVQAANLMTLFLGLEWFSIALYVLCAIDIDLVGSLEAGLKYLDHRRGRLGDAALRLGARLRRDRRSSAFDKIAAAGHTHDSLLVLGLAMMIAGLAFKSSAAPFHMWTPDAYQGAPTPVTAFMALGDEGRGARRHLPRARDRVSRRRAALDLGGRRRSRSPRSRSATSPRSPSATSSACSPTRRSRTPASC